VVAGEQAVPADTRRGASQRLPRLMGSRKRVALAGLVAVVAVAIVYCCALREASTVTTESDAASFALQGWAITHGNPLLHGWRLADVSFYTIDLPVYAIGVLVVGLRPDVVPACAAAVFTILAVLACATARGRSRGLAGVAAVLLTAAVMAGPAVHVSGVLTTPDHTGTALVPLVVALVIDRAGRGWRAGVLVCAVLAWGLVGDSLVLLTGVIPVVVICLARACRDRAARPELVLAGGAVASVAVFAVVKAVIRLLGGWQLDGSGHQLVPGRDLARNLGGTLQDVLNLFSASPRGRPDSGPGPILVAIHLALFSLVAIACWIALRRLFWNGDLVAALLASGIVANLAAYTLLFLTGPSTGQDIAPVFGMGAALAGRVLGGPLARFWQDRRAWPLLAAWAAVILAVAVPPLVTARPVPPANATLATWLTGHGLYSGIAQYWQANSVTLDSHGAITMRDVWDYGPAGGIRPYPWEENTSLLDPQHNYANFVIAAAHSGLTRPAIERRFGPPARVYKVGKFTVLVYDRNLMPDIASLPAPGPGPISF
jgi:hypothetical protein